MLDPPSIASRLNGVASSPVRDLLALTQQPHYPGLESHPQPSAAARPSPALFMLTFRVHSGAARADALVGAVRVLAHATSLDGVETTLERRARYRAERGIVPDDLLRVSVGCEHVEDL